MNESKYELVGVCYRYDTIVMLRDVLTVSIPQRRFLPICGTLT
jgi:hypothetical protein